MPSLAATTTNSSSGEANARCLRMACERLNISYRIYDAHGNFISVDLARSHFFANAATPFNTTGVARVCKDKEFSWLFLKDSIRTPRTKGYVDPRIDPAYRAYASKPDYESVADDIEEAFLFPMVVKMNRGQEGRNVFLCRDRGEVLDALTHIYNKHSLHYDYIALAQDYIPPKKEYRAIVFQGEIVLVYDKDCSNGIFVGNLSPLHYKNSVARSVNNTQLIQRMQEFLTPAITALNLEFGGLDILVDEKNDLHLLELNTEPGFNYFVRDNGEEELIQMYEKILLYLKENEERYPAIS